MVVVGQDASLRIKKKGPGSNAFDGEQWRTVFLELLSDLPSINAAAFGLAGYAQGRASRRSQARLIDELVSVPYTLTNDVDIACTGAFAGEAGLLMLSGTGSVAWMTDGNGRTGRVGGWGSLFGDEGSAFWIGREALSLLTRMLDGREDMDREYAGGLLQSLNINCRLDDAEACREAVLGWFAGLSAVRPEIASIAQSVDGLADRENMTAVTLLRHAARQLASHITAGRESFATISGDLAWSYAGSAFNSRTLLHEVEALCGPAVRPILSPIGGAVLRAAALLKWDVNKQWISKLNQQLQQIDA